MNNTQIIVFLLIQWVTGYNACVVLGWAEIVWKCVGGWVAGPFWQAWWYCWLNMTQLEGTAWLSPSLPLFLREHMLHCASFASSDNSQECVHALMQVCISAYIPHLHVSAML